MIAAAVCAAVVVLAVPATVSAADTPVPGAGPAETELVASGPVTEDPAATGDPVDADEPEAPAGDHDAVEGDAAADEVVTDDEPVVDEPVVTDPPEAPAPASGSDEPPGPAEPNELPGPAPTIEPRCWMGHNQPVYVVRNLDREHTMRYVLSAPGAGKRGQLAPRGEDRDSVWFVGTGRFPNPARVRVEYEIAGVTGWVVAPEAEPAYCTYGVRPIVRWLDADLNDVMPTAEQAAGWSLTLDGALGSLDCTWNGAGLTCRYDAEPGGPLPEGTYHSLGRETELRVPAFGDTAFTVRTSADPAGFRLVDGAGDTVLPDISDGLDQSSVDDRASWFFPARLQGGTAMHVLTITFASVELGPTEVRGTSAGRADPAAAVVPAPAAPRGASATANPAFTLPETGGSPLGLVGLGLALLVLGLGAALLASRTTIGARR